MSDQPGTRPKFTELMIVAATLIVIIVLVSLGAWQGMRSVPL